MQKGENSHKKLLAILLILSMLFSLTIALTGCDDSSDRRSSSSRRDRDDDDDDDAPISAGRDDGRIDAPVDAEPGDFAVSEATEPPTHTGELNEAVPVAVPLADLPIISDDKNLSKNDVKDAYGNEYVAPYFDLCSYGSAHRDGEYITQAVTEFNLDGKYRYFSGTIFTRPEQSENYTIEFMVFADDELVYSSGPIDRSTKPIDFVVEIGECDLIRVQTRTKDYTSTGTNPGIFLINPMVSEEKP